MEAVGGDRGAVKPGREIDLEFVGDTLGDAREVRGVRAERHLERLRQRREAGERRGCHDDDPPRGARGPQTFDEGPQIARERARRAQRHRVVPADQQHRDVGRAARGVVDVVAQHVGRGRAVAADRAPSCAEQLAEPTGERLVERRRPRADCGGVADDDETQLALAPGVLPVGCGKQRGRAAQPARLGEHDGGEQHGERTGHESASSVDGSSVGEASGASQIAHRASAIPNRSAP